MNIKIITTEPFPIGLAASNRIISYAKGLERNNCNVSVICMKPTEIPCHVFNITASGIFENIPYYYSCGNTVRDQYFINRRIDNLKGIIRICWNVLKEKKNNGTDVIIYYSSSTSRAVLLYLITRIKRILFLKEESELPVVYSSKMFFVQRQCFERLHYSLFDGFLLMTNRLVDYFQHEKNNNKPLLHVPMTVDSEMFIKFKKNPSGNKYIAYCGILNNKKDGVDLLLDSFTNISNDFPEINLYLIGECASEEECRSYNEKIKSSKLDKRVIFTGRVSKDAMPELLCNATILVLPRPKSVQSEGGFPTKLGEYLATGNPVVVTRVGEISDYLTDGVNAFLAEPSSIDSLEMKIREVLSDYPKAKRIGLEGQNVALHFFNYVIQTKSIIDFIRSFN